MIQGARGHKQCEKRKKRPEAHESGHRSGPINQKAVKFGTNEVPPKYEHHN